MTVDQQHIAMSSHACDLANEVQQHRERFAALIAALDKIPVRATELSRRAGVQTFGLYLEREDAMNAVTTSACRDLGTHDLVRREDVRALLAEALAQGGAA